jgi:hypothetical protein
VATCLRDVRDSDVYVLLLGRRYGYRPPLDNPSNLSITQLEFAEAVAHDKPLVVLEQANPPMHLSDADAGRDDDERSRKAFWKEVDRHATKAPWSDEASLVKAVLNGVHGALQRRRDKEREDAPAITPGVSPPHARLLSRSLLLVHLAGPDDALAARLAATLAERPIGWSLESWRWNVEDGIDWRALDQKLALSRAMAVLFTDSAPRFGGHAAALRQVVEFAQRQCGFVAGLVIGPVAAAMPWLGDLGLMQQHRLEDWAAGASGAITNDLASAVRDMRTRHRDIEDCKLVGLQCAVVAMNRGEAEELWAAEQQRDASALWVELDGAQRRYLAAAFERARQTGLDWLGRYGATREDWQPFGPLARAPQVRHAALAVLREVVDDINGQEVMPRRDQEALKGHRVRLRRYAFEPVVAGEPRVAKLMPQVLARRLLVLVDETSLCHPKVRAAAAGTLADPLLAVATVAPFDPPAQPVEQALEGSSVLRLGDLRSRFLVTMDPNCEVNLSSMTRLMRWLRLAIPDTLTGQGGVALNEHRARFLHELGLAR